MMSDSIVPVRRLVIATKNEGKAREFRELLKDYDVEVLTMTEAGINDDITEDGETFAQNAHIKARYIYDRLKMPVIADDSGLEVEFLDGAPGIYSARYGGVELTDSERCERILQELEGVDKPLRAAKFVCTLYYIKDDEREVTVSGELVGFIGEEPCGKNGFGYDPIFMIEDDVSVAMLKDSEKNEISHRSKALEKLLPELLKDIIER